MYSGEGGVYVSGGKCERWRKARFAWKKENAFRCVGEKNQRAFACTANVRLHGTITLVCGAANVHSRVL